MAPHDAHTNGYFWHDRLDAYQVALEFSAWVNRISPRIPRGRSHLRDQIVRASDSIVLNIAEGSAVRGKVGTNHYRIALRSTAECNAAVRLLEIAGVRSAPEGRRLTERLRSMIAGLAR